MRLILIGTAFLALAACNPSPAGNSSAANDAAVEAPVGPVKGIDRSRKGTAAPDVTFTDPDGGDISLENFKGVPVLLNLWATWCAPCVKELPTLDRLAQAHAADGKLGVIAVSQDVGPQPSVEAFLEKLKVRDLGAFHDPKMALSGALGAEVLPTTILFDAEGREVWRYVGDLDWTGSEAAKLLVEAQAGEKG
ncbi:MAG TPA: TlpA disulfide reductase family protein [Sphingomicrobium sp.]|nr:TlpA disulfide reductase family protein [Sphingomicrobium sp.]